MSEKSVEKTVYDYEYDLERSVHTVESANAFYENNEFDSDCSTFCFTNASRNLISRQDANALFQQLCFDNHCGTYVCTGENENSGEFVLRSYSVRQVVRSEGGNALAVSFVVMQGTKTQSDSDDNNKKLFRITYCVLDATTTTNQLVINENADDKESK